ncbi:hypothetical protein KNE206_16670 [Kitasatospora sp. NE20-6]
MSGGLPHIVKLLDDMVKQIDYFRGPDPQEGAWLDFPAWIRPSPAPFRR